MKTKPIDIDKVQVGTQLTTIDGEDAVVLNVDPLHVAIYDDEVREWFFFNGYDKNGYPMDKRSSDPPLLLYDDALFEYTQESKSGLLDYLHRKEGTLHEFLDFVDKKTDWKTNDDTTNSDVVHRFVIMSAIQAIRETQAKDENIEGLIDFLDFSYNKNDRI